MDRGPAAGPMAPAGRPPVVQERVVQGRVVKERAVRDLADVGGEAPVPELVVRQPGERRRGAPSGPVEWGQAEPQQGELQPPGAEGPAAVVAMRPWAARVACRDEAVRPRRKQAVRAAWHLVEEPVVQVPSIRKA